MQVGKAVSFEQYILWNMASLHLLSEGIVGKELLTCIIDSSPEVEVDCIYDTPVGSLRALSWVP